MQSVGIGWSVKVTTSTVLAFFVFLSCPLFYVFLGDGFLKTFFEKTKNMTPAGRGNYLEEDEVTECLLAFG